MLLTLQPGINHLWTGVDRLLARWRKLLHLSKITLPLLQTQIAPACGHAHHGHPPVLWLVAAFLTWNLSCGATLYPSSSCYLLSQALLSQALLSLKLSQSSVSFKQTGCPNRNAAAQLQSKPVGLECLPSFNCTCQLWNAGIKTMPMWNLDKCAEGFYQISPFLSIWSNMFV